jgi:malate dehydrogenase (quinone)
MYFAKKLELPAVKNLSLLCVAGNFYHTPKHLKTKVYTVQNPKLPFSAVHGDPDILNADKTRFGPTTRVIFMLERYRYSTVMDFFTTMPPVVKSLMAYMRIIFDREFFFYALKHNVLFQIPFLGNYLFVKEIRKIIPSLRYSDLKKAKGQGGVRPQIVDTSAKIPLSLGEAKLSGEDILFNVTPSPGATTCIYNGFTDVKTITKALGANLDREAVERDFGQTI